MYIKTKINSQKERFRQLCLKYHVESLHGFGSSTRADFSEGLSDIDLLVNLDFKDPIENGNALIGLWSDLQDFFLTKVDLLTPNSIKNPYLIKSIDRTKVLLYDGKRKKVVF
ncbi:MAG: nucleotidyltransferase domain-containing protein [Nonlabens sp.]